MPGVSCGEAAGVGSAEVAGVVALGTGDAETMPGVNSGEAAAVAAGVGSGEVAEVVLGAGDDGTVPGVSCGEAAGVSSGDVARVLAVGAGDAGTVPGVSCGEAAAVAAGVGSREAAGIVVLGARGVIGVETGTGEGVGTVATPGTTVVGAAPVYQGAKPIVCKYSIFCQTMVSQSGGLTSPPVSPEFAFQANQKKLLIGLCKASTGVPSARSLRRYEARSAKKVKSAGWVRVLPNSPMAIGKTCPPYPTRLR